MLSLVLHSIRALFRSRTELLIENVALRQQLAVWAEGHWISQSSVWLAVHASGRGYWEDGGIFNFGAAQFFGSGAGQFKNGVVGCPSHPTAMVTDSSIIEGMSVRSEVPGDIAVLRTHILIKPGPLS